MNKNPVICVAWSSFPDHGLSIVCTEKEFEDSLFWLAKHVGEEKKEWTLLQKNRVGFQDIAWLVFFENPEDRLQFQLWLT